MERIFRKPAETWEEQLCSARRTLIGMRNSWAWEGELIWQDSEEFEGYVIEFASRVSPHLVPDSLKEKALQTA